MKALLKFNLFLLLFWVSSPLVAEVFTLAPFGKKGTSGGVGDLSDAMGGAKLWSEPIVVNGAKTEMHLRMLRNDLKECYLTFKKQFPGSRFRFSPGALLVEFKHKDGTLERIYLVQLNGVYPVIQFAMAFPAGLPENNGLWLEGLPIPTVASVDMTISLPERKVDYGVFNTALRSDEAMADIKTSLTANDWTNLKQGVFIKNNPLAIMLISVSQDKKGVTRGFVLKRPFSK